MEGLIFICFSRLFERPDSYKYKLNQFIFIMNKSLVFILIDNFGFIFKILIFFAFHQWSISSLFFLIRAKHKYLQGFIKIEYYIEFLVITGGILGIIIISSLFRSPLYYALLIVDIIILMRMDKKVLEKTRINPSLFYTLEYPKPVLNYFFQPVFALYIVIILMIVIYILRYIYL